MKSTGNSIIFFVVLFGFLLAACPQPTNDQPLEDYQISVTPDTIEGKNLRPVGNYVDFGESLITVKNTGSQTIKGITVEMLPFIDDANNEYYNDRNDFILSDSSLGDLKSGDEATIGVTFDGRTQGVGRTWKILLKIGNDSASETVTVTYGLFDFEPIPITLDGKDYELEVGDTNVFLGTEQDMDSDKGDKPWISSNAAVAAVDQTSGRLTIHQAGEVILGYLDQENPFIIKGKNFVVYQAHNPPKVVSAEINRNNPLALNVKFDKAATADSTDGFSVSGSGTASTVTAVSGSGTDTLTLTLNRKPLYNETLSVAYDRTKGNARLYDTNPDSLPIYVYDFNQAVTLTGFTAETDVGPSVVSAVVDAQKSGNGFSVNDAMQLTLTFDKAVTAGDFEGFSLSGSTSAVYITEMIGSGSASLVFTMNNWASYSENGTFAIKYDQKTGNVTDNTYNPPLNFEKTITLNNYDDRENSGDVLPKIISVTVDGSNNGLNARVVFNRAVELDAGKMQMKIANWTNINYSLTPAEGETKLDIGLERRGIRKAVPVGGNEAIWDMTMNVPAKYGEVLWLACEEGAVWTKSNTDAAIAAVPRFIARNLIRRIKAPYEANPGFYKNGVEATWPGVIITDETRNGDDLYRVANMHNRFFGPRTEEDSGHPQSGDVFTLVINSDQTTKDIAAVWWSTENARGLRDAPVGATIIITTTTANAASAAPQDFTIFLDRDDSFFFTPGWNQTLIIDKHIIITHTNNRETAPAVTGRQPLMWVRPGGKLILDGGELRNNDALGQSAGAVRMMGAGAMGQYGSFLLINDGKISGNYSTSASYAGAVTLEGYSTVVMHGGEITNNTVESSVTATRARAGAIIGLNNSAGNHGTANFFMTGGIIGGNSVKGPASNVASAGGVLVSGSFQKTGGIIYGDDDASMANTTDMSGTVKAGAIAVLSVSGENTDSAFTRNGTSGPLDNLFVDSVKTGSTVAVNTVPTWAESFWDN